jgi:exonuclease VII large subunit
MIWALASRVPSRAPTAKPKGISLRELLTRVKRVVEKGMPDALWIRTEISELRSKSGNLFLHLAERNERGDTLAHLLARCCY